MAPEASLGLLGLSLVLLLLPSATAFFVQPSNVTAVCSSAKLAWLSAPACGSFESGICATVKSASKCNL
jgi:hypothetical protein